MGCGAHIGLWPCCEVHNADCREFDGYGLPDDAVIITDPPYGIAHPVNFKSAGRGKLADCTDYGETIIGDTERFNPSHVLSLNRPTVLWGANYFARSLPETSGWLVWDKKRPDTLDQATCELAWTNFVKGVRRFPYLWNGMMRDGDDTLQHPTQKPVDLTTWILGLKWTPPGMVIDLYAGSGAALVAAKRAGRHYLGFELSPTYCDIARRWLENPYVKQGRDSEPPPLFAL